MIKLGIQLYLAHGVYVVDIQKLKGELFPYLDVSASIFSALKINDS